MGVVDSAIVLVCTCYSQASLSLSARCTSHLAFSSLSSILSTSVLRSSLGVHGTDLPQCRCDCGSNRCLSKDHGQRSSCHLRRRSGFLFNLGRPHGPSCS